MGKNLKTLLSEGLSEPEFYGDLVYKFKKLKGINDFSFQFRKIITRYRRIGYNLNVMRQSACLVFNPIIIDNYSTVSVMFISLTLTNVEFRMSRDFFPWILRGISVDFA